MSSQELGGMRDKEFESAKKAQQERAFDKGFFDGAIQKSPAVQPEAAGTHADRPRWDLVDTLRTLAHAFKALPGHPFFAAADRLQALEMEKIDRKPSTEYRVLFLDRERIKKELEQERRAHAAVYKKLDVFEQAMLNYQNSWYAEVGRVQQAHKELAQTKEALRVQSENHLPVVAQLGAAQRRIKELCAAIDFAQYKLGQVTNG